MIMMMMMMIIIIIIIIINYSTLEPRNYRQLQYAKYVTCHSESEESDVSCNTP